MTFTCSLPVPAAAPPRDASPAATARKAVEDTERSLTRRAQQIGEVAEHMRTDRLPLVSPGQHADDLVALSEFDVGLALRRPGLLGLVAVVCHHPVEVIDGGLEALR
mgnify:CR=1 FL=1